MSDLRNVLNSIQKISSPLDYQWQEMVANAKVASPTPYYPGSSGNTVISMNGFTGFVIRAKFTAALTVDPIITVFGGKNEKWSILKDANGARTITLADQSTLTDNTFDGTYYYTDLSEKIDALGCEYVQVIVQTAAASTGAVSIELSRY
jgi:hypothetical protein